MCLQFQARIDVNIFHGVVLYALNPRDGVDITN
jgi:hypothetical protein